MSEGTTRAVFAAFAGNLLIAITKAVAAALTGSGALLAETAHSIADSLNQILLYVGIRRSVQPPTKKHPLGHGKERYFWALVVALFLFFGGGVFSLYQAYDRIAHPHELGDATIGFIVLGLSMVFEMFSLSVAVRELRHAAHAEACRWEVPLTAPRSRAAHGPVRGQRGACRTRRGDRRPRAQRMTATICTTRSRAQ